MAHPDEHDLDAAIAAYYAGRPDPHALIRALRAALVLVPVRRGHDVITLEQAGIRWVPAFTTSHALAGFVRSRPEVGRAYVAIRGARLQDAVRPALPGAVGTALDPGGPRPMLFPPVIVPRGVPR